jgi:hypothetical protein
MGHPPTPTGPGQPPHADTPVTLELDHLVIGTASLEEGAAWCEATFGVTPEPGGRHVFMGTHNRLLRLAGPLAERGPGAYLELLAIDPEATAPARPRWFGLDEPEVRARLASGPCLLHWVARTADPAALRARWAAAGCDPGPVEAAERATPRGVLRWQLTIPQDGRPTADGVVPALIAWDGPHPATGLDLGRALRMEHLQLDTTLASLGADLSAASTARGPTTPAFEVTLRGPGGMARLALGRGTGPGGPASDAS